jgi:hypothetical protein
MAHGEGQHMSLQKLFGGGFACTFWQHVPLVFDEGYSSRILEAFKYDFLDPSKQLKFSRTITLPFPPMIGVTYIENLPNDKQWRALAHTVAYVIEAGQWSVTTEPVQKDFRFEDDDHVKSAVQSLVEQGWILTDLHRDRVFKPGSA